METIEIDYQQEYNRNKKEFVIARLAVIKSLYTYERYDTKIKDPDRALWYCEKTKKIFIDEIGFPGVEIR